MCFLFRKVKEKWRVCKMRFERIFPGQSVVSVFCSSLQDSWKHNKCTCQDISKKDSWTWSSIRNIFKSLILSTSACVLNHFIAGLWDFSFFLCRNECLSLAKELIQCWWSLYPKYWRLLSDWLSYTCSAVIPMRSPAVTIVREDEQLFYLNF